MVETDLAIAVPEGTCEFPFIPPLLSLSLLYGSRVLRGTMVIFIRDCCLYILEREEFN